MNGMKIIFPFPICFQPISEASFIAKPVKLGIPIKLNVFKAYSSTIALEFVWLLFMLTFSIMISDINLNGK